MSEITSGGKQERTTTKTLTATHYVRILLFYSPIQELVHFFLDKSRRFLSVKPLTSPNPSSRFSVMGYTLRSSPPEEPYGNGFRSPSDSTYMRENEGE